MFSGITGGLFEVIQVERLPGLLNYTVRFNESFVSRLRVGASISINGVCQTVTSIHGSDVSFNAIQETLVKTTLSTLAPRCFVSAERSICYGDEIGGHEVAGHVIGTAMIIDVVKTENNIMLLIQCPQDWINTILPKGFIALDGSSLTVGEVNPEGSFTVYLIPATLRLTNFGNKKAGDLVNVELDQRTQAIVATVERILSGLTG